MSKPEPPNLRTGLAQRPDVKALLDEMSKDLGSSEGPFFYEMTEARDPNPLLPDEARDYVPPVEVKDPKAHSTLEMAKVAVSKRGNPRYAETVRSAKPSASGSWRRATLGAVIAMAGIAIGVIAMLRQPIQGERTSATAATTAKVSVPMPTAINTGNEATPLPTTSAMSSASAPPSIKPPSPASSPRGAIDDPYQDAAPPRRKVDAPSAPPSPPAPSVSATAAPPKPMTNSEGLPVF